MQKTFAYVRVSGRAQVDGDGFPRQIAAIRRYAGAQGLRIAHVFEECAVSGKTDPTENLASRPAWIEMLSAIAGNGVRTIIIEKLERLARDLMVQEHILADLQRRGIVLISVAEPDLCSDDPTRTLLRQIMGAIAEYDRKMIVLKLRGARQRKRVATGRCEGEKPYGSHPKYPDERRTLEQMIKLRREGCTLQAIVDSLNAAGEKPRYGEQWGVRSVQGILRRVTLRSPR